MVGDPKTPLKNNAKTCRQGTSNDANFVCSPYRNASHIVCGHKGTFSFSYPNYVVPETFKFLDLSVRRTGGGFGNITINYFLKHFTTNDSDVTATAPYTTSQTLYFAEGMYAI